MYSTDPLIRFNVLECPFGTYGNKCAQKCSCGHGCDPRTGECLQCPAGRSGILCEQSCPFERWGEKCKNHCDCSISAECDSIDGSCQCYNGFIGEKCNRGIWHSLRVADRKGYFSTSPACFIKLWQKKWTIPEVWFPVVRNNCPVTIIRSYRNWLEKYILQNALVVNGVRTALKHVINAVMAVYAIRLMVNVIVRLVSWEKSAS